MKNRRTRIIAGATLALLGLADLETTVAGQPQAHEPPERREVAAVRLHEGERLTLDGLLDEAAWARAEPAESFVQAEPYEGTPATEATDIRVLYDRDNLYFGILCRDSQPDRLLTTSLRRDFNENDTDMVGIALSPFDDRRNGFLFLTTPDGAQHDAQVTDDGVKVNENWDAVWHVRARQTPSGWAAEVAIPFKTLRFTAGASQAWGVNFDRRMRRKNEVARWSFVPRRFDLGRFSMAGRLVGLEGVRQGRNLKVKPYGLVSVDNVETGSHKGSADGGWDVKYGLTSSLVLDLTLNTDFSQVEVDQQQINLTRFPLFFPEKRDFFLESADLFHFGVGAQEKQRGRTASEEFVAFFSRRIGLSPEGLPLPIWGGARLTGRLGDHSLGLLQMSTRSTDRFPGNDYTVLRLRRDLFRKSDVGGVFLNRSGEGSDFSRVVGADANFEFMDRLTLSSFVAKSYVPGSPGDDLAGKLSAQWADNFLGISGTYVDVGENFNDDMGFIRRKGIRVLRSGLDLHPRPKRSSWIREFHPHAYLDYFMDRDNHLLTRNLHLGLWIYFQDGSRMEVYQSREFEELRNPFRIRRDISIPVGTYSVARHVAQYSWNPSKPVAGSVRYNWGGFWSGRFAEWTLTGILRHRPDFSAELSYVTNDVRLREGSFRTHLAGVRLRYAFSTRQFLDLFAQHNSISRLHSVQVRYNLIHRPLSDLFIVYHEQRTAHEDGLRSLSLKFTRLFEF
ncbi:MAG: carbohydrate binding family 9 domain-containing protein [Acidobacteria bacterium]|nr:carbohydrate binding family 9 domain-containing protein [Acidobacteriota bacterium]